MAMTRRLVKEVATDPGVGFGVANVLLFVSVTNSLGLAACVLATVVAAVSRAVCVEPNIFLNRYPRLLEILADGRTPLRVNALSLLVVGGVALAAGALLPAVTSVFFAIANYWIAESISRALRNIDDVAVVSRLPALQRLAHLIFKRADFYICTGMSLSGLMAGGAALWIFPLVALAFALMLRNAWQEKPEHQGHPKVLAATARFIFALIGFASGNISAALSHVLGTYVMLDIEARITPGGARQVMQDMRGLPHRFRG